MADCGFPKQKRLLTPADFRAAFSKSQFKVSCRYFLILATSNDQPGSRLGVVIAKKNVAKAVQRNRIKRHIRECFRQQKILPGLDIVVLARKDADTLDNQNLRRSLTALLSDLSTKLTKLQKLPTLAGS